MSGPEISKETKLIGGPTNTNCGHGLTSVNPQDPNPDLSTDVDLYYFMKITVIAGIRAIGVL